MLGDVVADSHAPDARSIRGRVPRSLLMVAAVQVFCGHDFAFLSRLAAVLPLTRPVTVLDAGANVGLVTALLAQARALPPPTASAHALPAQAGRPVWPAGPPECRVA